MLVIGYLGVPPPPEVTSISCAGSSHGRTLVCRGSSQLGALQVRSWAARVPLHVGYKGHLDGGLEEPPASSWACGHWRTMAEHSSWGYSGGWS